GREGRDALCCRRIGRRCICVPALRDFAMRNRMCRFIAPACKRKRIDLADIKYRRKQSWRKVASRITRYVTGGARIGLRLVEPLQRRQQQALAGTWSRQTGFETAVRNRSFLGPNRLEEIVDQRVRTEIIAGRLVPSLNSH